MIFCPLIKQQCFVEKAEEEGRDGDTCALWSALNAECRLESVAKSIEIAIDIATDPEHGLYVNSYGNVEVSGAVVNLAE